MDLKNGIEGKVVVYTGAAGLIGSEACKELARLGARLALLDPNVEALRRLQADLKAAYPGLISMCCSDVDTLSETSIGAFLDAVESTLGSIDCLVASAYPRTKDWHKKLEDIPFESWRKNVDDHLNGYFLISRECGRRMARLGRGNIVFFSSIYGLRGPRFGVYEDLEGMTMPAAYSAIKGGISNYTRYLASYLGPKGVRVNAICPGGVESEQDPRFIAAYEKMTPLGRMAKVSDVTGPLLFLVSDLSRYVTGVNLVVDGGWSAT